MCVCVDIFQRGRSHSLNFSNYLLKPTQKSEPSDSFLYVEKFNEEIGPLGSWPDWFSYVKLVINCTEFDLIRVPDTLEQPGHELPAAKPHQTGDREETRTYDKQADKRRKMHGGPRSHSQSSFREPKAHGWLVDWLISRANLGNVCHTSLWGPYSTDKRPYHLNKHIDVIYGGRLVDLRLRGVVGGD